MDDIANAENRRKIDTYLEDGIKRIAEAIGLTIEVISNQTCALYEAEPLSSDDDPVLLTQPLTLRIKEYVLNGVAYPQVAFNKPEHRDAFLDALIERGLDPLLKNDESFFPLHDTLTRGGKDWRRTPSDGALGQGGLVFAGTDVCVSVRLADDNEDRLLFAERDSKARYFPNALAFLGGTTPQTLVKGSIGKLNSNSAWIVEHEGRYFMLFMSDQGETGITREDKEAQRSLALTRLRKLERKPRHKNKVFANMKPEDIQILDVAMITSDIATKHQKRVTLTADIDGQEISTICDRVVLHTPKINAVTSYAALKLPEQAKGIPLNQLELGKNLFIVDVASKDFQRKYHLFTREESQYARMPDGDATHDDDTHSGGKSYGIFQNNTWPLLEAIGYCLNIPAAKAIISWGKRLIIRRNTSGRGGPYMLVEDRSRPAPKLSPSPSAG